MRTVRTAIGVALYGSAVAAVFVLADAQLARPVAIAVVAATGGVAPLLLAAALVRAFRKNDPSTGFISTLAGTMGGLSLLLLLGIALLKRAPLARALGAAPARYPALGTGTRRVLETLGAWLAPAAAPPSAAPPAPSDLARPTPPPAPAPGPMAAPGPGSATATATARGFPSPPARDAASVFEVCDRVSTIVAVNLGDSEADEIVVGCDDGVHVLWPRLQIPAVVERTRIRTRAAEGQHAIARDDRVVDVDGDGLLDILTCVLVISDAGGTRGGGVWLHRGQPGGLFAPGMALFRNACGGADLGDVTGSGRYDLVVASVGNPYREATPNGQLVWLARAGRARFVRRGAQPLLVNPIELWIADANEDGVDDVIVNHGWDNDGPIVLPSSARGPGPMEPGIRAPPRPNRRLRIQARLDDDAQPDAVGPAHPEIFDGALRIELSSAPPALPAAIIPASDHQDLED